MFEKLKQILPRKKVVVEKEKIELSEFHCDMSNRVNRMNILFILLSVEKDTIKII
tara:strand:- start:10 stop:174 length:165 start_codon:yes stop_codon:yes gene_type:complete